MMYRDLFNIPLKNGRKYLRRVLIKKTKLLFSINEIEK